ncbi:MAG: hypothetical protein ACOX3B_03525 [Bacilli bacterium]|nr:hypothetical protein [Bacillota bacterium]NLI51928.1 hypothetical protein [Erysipelotrichaceae bacterium]OQC50129.1 MAG: hypothetical protein BWX57_00444 [Tenericutes bacterium ADurb.Bin024]HOA11388.1 hypothetical protein [Bacilli bacterium]TAH59106.1 MAG: hypothetical protein EWM49_01750 [Bacillota bacterium]
MIIIYGGAFFLVIVIAIFSALVLGGIKITIINALIALVVAAFLTYRVTNYRKDIEKRRFMFNFMEYFILNFDIQKTVEATLTTIYPLLDVKKSRVYLTMNEDGMLLLEKLRLTFAHQYYESFLEMVKLINEHGGEMLKVAEVLLFSISNSETQLIKLTRIDNAYLIKFIFNWFFIMLVAIVFRLALDGFLKFETLPLIYVAGMEVFIAIFLTSIVLVFENRIRRTRRVS